MIKHKQWVELPIGRLVPADWNYKVDDEERAAKLAANIKRNGQVENILVREMDGDDYEVVNGNHRLTVFERLGLKKIVCFNLGTITDSQAKRIAIETNETRFDTDNMKLAGLLSEIVADGSALKELELTMPFSLEELTGFEDLLEFDWANIDTDGKPDGGGDGGGGGTDTKVSCPECGHEFDPNAH